MDVELEELTRLLLRLNLKISKITRWIAAIELKEKPNPQASKQVTISILCFWKRGTLRLNAQTGEKRF